MIKHEWKKVDERVWVIKCLEKNQVFNPKEEDFEIYSCCPICGSNVRKEWKENEMNYEKEEIEDLEERNKIPKTKDLNTRVGKYDDKQ